MKNFLGIIFVLSLFGCREPESIGSPKNLIPRNDMISILIDLEIMEAYYQQVHKRTNLYKTTLDSASRQILADSKYTEAQLKNTLNYYSAVPDSLYQLFEETLDSLNSKVIKNKNNAKQGDL